MPGPFDLGDESAYRAWRERKLAEHPRRAEDLVVEVRDPKQLTSAERAALIERCARANMALYTTRAEVDKAAVRALGRQLGLERLDRNWLADEDGISSITPGAGTRGEFIPYTERALGWHTDGVYNVDERRIHAMALHCVRNAAEGGESAFVDHEIVWLLLHDESPDYAHALFALDAMSVPPRYEDGRLARAEQSGPVYSVVEGGAGLHMRYSGRGTHIAWKDDAATRGALAFITRTLEGDSPFVFRLRLAPGMGIVCNNVLHKRNAFSDAGDAKRLLYRARYLDRVARA
jgi:alpha-ketoglutarate-dependent taurine dioxygenase